MWNERVNEFLDGDRRLEEATDEERREIRIYRKIISIYAAKTAYVPSEASKEMFLRRIRKRKITTRLGIIAAVAALIFVLFLPLMFSAPASASDAISLQPNDAIQQNIETEVMHIDVEAVRTVMDGF